MLIISDLKFVVNKQRLILKSGGNHVINKSNNYLKLYFNFTSSEWLTFENFCIIQDSKNSYLYHIEDSETPVILGSQMLQGKYFIVGVYGVHIHDETQIRATTNVYKVNMGESNYTNNIVPIDEETKDIIADLYSKITQINHELLTKADINHTHNVEDIIGLGDMIDSDINLFADSLIEIL